MDPFIFVNYNQSSKSDPKLKNIGHTINVMFDFENTPMVSMQCVLNYLKILNILGINHLLLNVLFPFFR